MKYVNSATGSDRGDGKPKCADGYYEYNGICHKSGSVIQAMPGAFATYYEGCGGIHGKLNTRNTLCSWGPYEFTKNADGGG